MWKKISGSLIFCLLFGAFIFAQDLKEIKGKVSNDEDIEGIHILNKDSNKYTTTDEKGNFIIQVKLNDTLIVSSLRYFAKQIVIDQEILTSNVITIQLEEFVNELDEVIVGKILTGNLNMDLDITSVKRDIDFYDVGIPGNTDLPITQNERRLQEADHGKFIYYYGIGFAINVNKILNRVSGRTRQLKEFVALDQRDECMEKARLAFQDILFPEDKYPREVCYVFFFFASEDEDFHNTCQVKNDMAMFSFLEKKQKQFIENLNSTED